MNIKHVMIAAATVASVAVLVPGVQAGERDGRQERIVVKGERMSAGEARKTLQVYLRRQTGVNRIMGSWVRNGFYYANVSNNMNYPTATYRVNLETGRVVRLESRR